MTWPLQVQGADGETHVFGPTALFLGEAIGACVGCGRSIWLRNIPRDVATLRKFKWPMQRRQFPHPLWSAERPPAVPAETLYANHRERGV